MMMNPSLTDIVSVKPIGDDTFVGMTPRGAFNIGIIFGGQLLAQSLSAAIGTVEGRRFNSFHAYFLSAGRLDQPVEFKVERAREGRIFAVRRVVGSQNGKTTILLTASFKQQEPGATHQDTMPDVPPPDAFAPWSHMAKWEEAVHNFPFELRRVIPAERPPAPGSPPIQRFWIRAAASLEDSPHVQDAALAYISDYALLSTCMIPHRMAWDLANPVSASLDQSVWRHRDTDLREWHLVDLRSPNASDARGLGLGSIWRHDGTLVASTAQEGMMREDTARV